MSIHKTEALVLKTMPFRSSSLIVTFFTPHLGKVRGVVKGVHREGEIRQAGFELFTPALPHSARHASIRLAFEAAAEAAEAAAAKAPA